jgi:hypothetical protein
MEWMKARGPTEYTKYLRSIAFRYASVWSGQYAEDGFNHQPPSKTLL